MAIFTKRFADADEYEEWLEKASGRVNVLEIVKQPTIYGSSAIPKNGPITLSYQTHDKTFAPPKSTTGMAVQYALVATAFFAVLAYLIVEL